MGRWTNDPWSKHYYTAKSRCACKTSSYHKYGITVNLTKEDLKFLWLRDGAGSMKKPSLDRINNSGNYSLVNCRFIEDSDNKKRLRRKSDSTRNKFKGVSYQPDHKKFRAIINKRHLGYFSTELEASKAYDVEALKLGGC